MSGRDWGDVAFAVFVLAAVSLMVRPGSVAPAVIAALGGAMTALVGFAADPQTGTGGSSG
jgi:hypothetical protein